MTIRSSFVVGEIGRLKALIKKGKISDHMLIDSLCGRFGISKEDARQAIRNARRMGAIELLEDKKVDRFIIKVKYPPY